MYKRQLLYSIHNTLLDYRLALRHMSFGVLLCNWLRLLRLLLLLIEFHIVVAVTVIVTIGAAASLNICAICALIGVVAVVAVCQVVVGVVQSRDVELFQDIGRRHQKKNQEISTDYAGLDGSEWIVFGSNSIISISFLNICSVILWMYVEV